jgi:uncharacterized protein (TIGR02453 family)
MWPRGAVQFLRELEDNNDREWFRANRTRYDEQLLKPAQQLASKLSYLGEPRFFRPYRDTRFRPGPPIKEQLAFGLGMGEVGGYYVELSLDGLLVGAGLYHPSSDQLERFRLAIDDARRARGFEQALSAAGAAGLEPIEPALKRAPKGYPSDHPRIDRLRMKSLTVFRRDPVGRWLHSADSDERIESSLRAARPLVKWVADKIGPPVPAR